MLQRLIDEDVGLVWKPGVDSLPVKMDPSQIDQILANLCVDARDAIAGAGQVVIETANVSSMRSRATSLGGVRLVSMSGFRCETVAAAWTRRR